MQIKAILEQVRRPLYKNSLFLIADRAMTAGLGFFFWMVVARFYSETDVGYGSATISAITLLSTLSLAGLGTSLIRFLPSAQQPVEMINSCLTVSSIISLLLAITFLLGVNIWSPALNFVKQEPVFGVAFIFYTIVFTSSHILDSVFVTKRRAHLVLMMDLISSSLKIILPFLLVLYFHSFGIASSAGIAVTIAVTAGLFFLTRFQKGYKPLPTINLEILRKFWRYSTGTYLASILWLSPGWVLPIIILNTLGSQQNAYFYITWLLASIISAIPIAASVSLFAEGSNNEDLRTNTKNTLKFAYILLIPAVVIVLLFGSWILSLFGVGYSINGSALLKILTLASLFVGINNIYYSILRIKNRIGELGLISAIQAVAVLTAGYFMATRTGIIGIGYIWLGSQIAVSLYAVFSLGKIFNIKPELL